jgi:hypothetical protein
MGVREAMALAEAMVLAEAMALAVPRAVPAQVRRRLRRVAPTRRRCDSFCALRVQAACNTMDTHAECFAACTEEGDLEANCASEFASLVNCASGAPMLCNGQAPRVSVDCAAQSSAYQACMEANDWVSLSLEPCDVYSCQGLCHIAYGCVECLENTHCGRSEECSFSGNVCRQRCLDDTDCPGAFCASTGVCGDPVGTPCEDYSIARGEGASTSTRISPPSTSIARSLAPHLARMVIPARSSSAAGSNQENRVNHVPLSKVSDRSID